jgi:exodeoxyribonuclease V gamma subunit
VTPDARLQPGLHLHTSNRLETLAAALAQVTRAPLSSPFRREAVVVQSQGMARWLKHRLADRQGVCANAAFFFPNDMASELFLATFPELPSTPPFDRDVMLWLVMKHLPALLDEPGFEAPGRYLADRADLRKRHQLARKLAHLFDQYFIFRPELIRAWDRGEDAQWQAELWRRIRPEILHRHPAELQEQFARRVPLPGFDTSRLPERLCVFGISALPPFHLALFVALGARLPVHLFVVQPSRFYWGDITSGREEERLLKRHRREPSAAAELHLERGNRLLASFGSLGRDFLKLIYESGDWQEHDDFTEPEGDTLLARIQSDILNLRDRALRRSAPVPGRSGVASQESRGISSPVAGADLVAPGDGRTPEPASVAPSIPPCDDSLQVHSCHSPLREMEVLHDHLLDWFNRDPGLAPRDVVVMSPDIETHAPFIEAVFGSPEDESRRIPFRIADRGARQASQLVQTFLALLRLPQTRLGAATVLALLENRAVRERFSLSESDLKLARRWIEETRIRWGNDAAHRARLGLPALAGNTWREGLDRLLLGYAMAGRGQALFDGLAPYDDLEGDSALVLGHLVEFIERLFATVADLGQPRPLHEWAARLQRVLEEFFRPGEEHEPEAQTIRSALHRLRQQQDLSQFREAVDLDVVLEHLAPELEQDRHGAGFLSGGVTFCALKPMRSIPFKVICLVGLNDAAFPRPNPHLGFDLMARAPRLGDRSTRDDDRYLFLETILSARTRLYVSYVGQSVRDNRSIPPSVVVSELLDYVEQGFGLAREQLVTRHRLQAFHESYFRPEGPQRHGVRPSPGAETCEWRAAPENPMIQPTGDDSAPEDGRTPTGKSDRRLFSYSMENCRASQAARQPAAFPAPFLAAPLAEPEPEFRRLTLDDLAAFFCNPAAFFLQRRLRVRLRQTADALEEREPFDLDARDGYAIRQRWLEDRLAGMESKPAQAQVVASGLLPLGQVGRACGESVAAAVESFRQRLQPFAPSGGGVAVEADFALGPFRLIGRIHPREAGGVLNYRVAAVKAQDILRLWIQHLAAGAGGRGGESILVGTNVTHRYSVCSDAREGVEQLLELYWHGLRQPLKFFPRSSRAFAEAEHRLAHNPNSKANPFVEALKEWDGNEFTGKQGDRADLNFALCFGEQPPFDDEFAALARRVFEPILEHETVEKA